MMRLAAYRPMICPCLDCIYARRPTWLISCDHNAIRDAPGEHSPSRNCLTADLLCRDHSVIVTLLMPIQDNGLISQPLTFGAVSETFGAS